MPWFSSKHSKAKLHVCSKLSFLSLGRLANVKRNVMAGIFPYWLQNSSILLGLKDLCFSVCQNWIMAAIVSLFDDYPFSGLASCMFLKWDYRSALPDEWVSRSLGRLIGSRSSVQTCILRNRGFTQNMAIVSAWFVLGGKYHSKRLYLNKNPELYFVRHANFLALVHQNKDI